MHRAERSVPRDLRYLVTPEGHEALTAGQETCHCPEMSYQRNTLVCEACGTVYAVAQLRTYRSGWSRMAWTTTFGSPCDEPA